MCGTEGSRNAYKATLTIYSRLLMRRSYLAVNRTQPGQGSAEELGSCFVTLMLSLSRGEHLQRLSPERVNSSAGTCRRARVLLRHLRGLIPQQGLRGPTAIHHLQRPVWPCSEISGDSRGCCFMQGFNFSSQERRKLTGRSSPGKLLSCVWSSCC